MKNQSKTESKDVKYSADRDQRSLSFCDAGTATICCSYRGIKKRLAGLYRSSDRFLYNRCADADTESNTCIAVVCNTIFGSVCSLGSHEISV